MCGRVYTPECKTYLLVDVESTDHILFIMSIPLARLSCHGMRPVPRISHRMVLNTRQSSNSAVSEAAKQNITWPEYLEIRRSKRKWETVSSLESIFALAHTCIRPLPFQHVFLDLPEGLLTLVLWKLTLQSLSWCAITCHTFVLRTHSTLGHRPTVLLCWLHIRMHGCVTLHTRAGPESNIVQGLDISSALLLGLRVGD